MRASIEDVAGLHSASCRQAERVFSSAKVLHLVLGRPAAALPAPPSCNAFARGMLPPTTKWRDWREKPWRTFIMQASWQQ